MITALSSNHTTSKEWDFFTVKDFAIRESQRKEASIVRYETNKIWLKFG